MRSYILILGIIIALASCKKAEEMRFDHTAGVYFDFQFDGRKDSLVETFAYNPTLAQDTVWIPVRISGVRTGAPRTFRARIETDSTSAVEGLHYEALKDNYTIPANAGFAWLPFVIYNKDPELENRAVSAIIKLTASEDFHIENPYWIRAKVVFSAKLEKPHWWDMWPLPPYSRVKHELFIIVTGVTELSTDGLDAPKNLYITGLLTTMLNNPFNWVTKNAAKGYRLEEVTPGNADSYYFFNINNPTKKTLLRKNQQNGKYYFIDENGNEVI
ncbi:DUF4843 domain-containing protein [Pedobacter faecalis]|uniref:DUF4843 domain-containing protein n=1 Tax=Pedobacter faecalis TaxID=3041495 RepID=UPI002550EEB8|nr:DUF4843 domain-containing protein [Pedobacter sp. ELA7]